MFAWQERPNPYAKKAAEARRNMYQRDLHERATLLYRLGYTAAHCKERLSANVDWDFEMQGKPQHAANVGKIVDAIYRRGGGDSGPPTL